MNVDYASADGVLFDSCSPIFIMGSARSGTTLLRSALNNSPRVHIATETHYFDDLRPRLGRFARQPVPRSHRSLCEDYFLALGHRPYGHRGSAEQSSLRRQRLREVAEALGGSGDAYFEAFCRLSASGKASWGEKTPRHVFNIDEILSVYPRAKVICMLRDAKAVIASYRNWGDQGGFDYDRDPGHRLAVAHEQLRFRNSYHIAISSMLWCGVVGAAFDAQRRFGRERIRIQRFEDLIREPESELEALFRWLDLGFSPKVLEVPMHNSSFSSYKKNGGFSQAPLFQWRSRLSDSEIGVVNHLCRKALIASGYDAPLRSGNRVSVALSYLTLPWACIRAVIANRRRIPNLPSYLARRLRYFRLASSR